MVAMAMKPPEPPEPVDQLDQLRALLQAALAAAAPERVGAIASFHGGRLATDEPTSPHVLLASTKVAALICIAQNDDERDPEAKTTLKQAAANAKLSAEIEVYPAPHGWCTIDSPVYNKEQAERAWTRMLATFERHL